MKLNKENANYAVVKTAFHGGGPLSYHRSLAAATRALRKWQGTGSCQCGCGAIVPIHPQAADDLLAAELRGAFLSGAPSGERAPLLEDLPVWAPGMSPYTIAK